MVAEGEVEDGVMIVETEAGIVTSILEIDHSFATKEAVSVTETGEIETAMGATISEAGGPRRREGVALRPAEISEILGTRRLELTLNGLGGGRGTDRCLQALLTLIPRLPRLPSEEVVSLGADVAAAEATGIEAEDAVHSTRTETDTASGAAPRTAPGDASLETNAIGIAMAMLTEHPGIYVRIETAVTET